MTAAEVDIQDARRNRRSRPRIAAPDPLAPALPHRSATVPRRPWIRVSLALSVLSMGWAVGQKPEWKDFIRTDPDKVVLSEACGECHRSALAVWKTTPHAKGFNELHHEESAQEIAKAMGFFLVKRESLCLKCHYTPVVRRGQLRAAAGVSCESCHGPAKDWINVHNQYGVPESDFQKARLLETPQHKAQRIAQSEAAGMLRPSNLYALASNCYQCHTVPEEKLVNVGRHSTGSAGFELLAWSQGEIRHNFLDSFLTGDGTVNAEKPVAHKRLLYLVGRALDFEYSLRGLAAATADGRYYRAMRRRYRSALGEMRAIAERTSLPQVAEMLAAVQGASIRFDNGDELLRTADTVGDAARRMMEGRDGSALAGLDTLISGEAAPELVRADEEAPAAENPAAADPPVVAERPVEASAPSRPETVPAAPSPTPTADAVPAEAAAAAPDRPRRTVSDVGRIQTRPPWRPVPSHRTIGPGECGSCHDHSDQDEWWLDDEHYLTADRLLDENPKALQIARFYGLSSSQMKRGNQICMQCHGSVVSGRENRETAVGVGCESCHGPGADFKEPHQESRDEALTLGMVDLKDLRKRAETCAGCHYINDPRLLSAGHPSGSEFDLGDRNAKIQHWDHALADPGRLRAAYRSVIADRGPIPSVERLLDLDAPEAAAPEVARTAPDPPAIGSRTVGSVDSPPAATSSVGDSTGAERREPAQASAGTPATSADRAEAADSAAPTSVSPSPGAAPREQLISGEGLSIHETLLQIKLRLERLHRESKRRKQ